MEMQYIDNLTNPDGSRTHMGTLIDNLNTGITLAFLAELIVRITLPYTSICTLILLHNFSTGIIHACRAARPHPHSRPRCPKRQKSTALR